MENLIKPVDYAKKMGISRQAVYAKIKKGLLPAKNVEGKIYIVLEGEEVSPPGDTEALPGDNPRSVQALLEAKEETIAVLKETIRDLKETNRMITSTLRSEVELLKEAFGEMKTLYAARLERLEPQEITVAELAEEPQEPSGDTASESLERDEATEWIGVEEFFAEQRIAKKKLRKRFLKRVEKLYAKGESQIRQIDDRYEITAPCAAKLLSQVLQKGR